MEEENGEVRVQELTDTSLHLPSMSILREHVLSQYCFCLSGFGLSLFPFPLFLPCFSAAFLCFVLLKDYNISLHLSFSSLVDTLPLLLSCCRVRGIHILKSLCSPRSHKEGRFVVVFLLRLPLAHHITSPPSVYVSCNFPPPVAITLHCYYAPHATTSTLLARSWGTRVHKQCIAQKKRSKNKPTASCSQPVVARQTNGRDMCANKNKQKMVAHHST